MSLAIQYRGVNRRGTSCVGSTVVESVADWVQAKYDARWTELDVFVGDDEVGGIGPHPETGNRCWWGEA